MEIIGVDKCKFVDYTKSNDFYLFEVGLYKCEPGYSYGPITRTQTIFHYVKSGKGHLVLDGRHYDIHGNQGFLIPPHCKAYYEADQEDPWSYAWIHVDGPRCAELFATAGITHDQPIFTPNGDASEIMEIIDDICEHSERECYCFSKVYEFFDIITSKSVDSIHNEVDPQLVYVRNAIRFIQLKYPSPITVETIAAACELNRSYLTRLFKSATGYTPQSYLFTYRMKKASELLLESSESINNIAFMVGYSDVFTFSKAFKRYRHQSPSDYRANGPDFVVEVTKESED